MACFSFSISTHAPAGGATAERLGYEPEESFLLTPLREGRPDCRSSRPEPFHFYSRPCGRGDEAAEAAEPADIKFLLTPLREGRPTACNGNRDAYSFLLTPLREGRQKRARRRRCGGAFLLTPLREGRLMRFYKKYHTFLYFYSRPCGRGDGVGKARQMDGRISTHAPAGGATRSIRARTGRTKQFLLTPLREGRRKPCPAAGRREYFYSRPCGRGDLRIFKKRKITLYFYSRPCGRGDQVFLCPRRLGLISTHAPAGGATAVKQDGAFAGYAISTHAPAGGATRARRSSGLSFSFLLTPLREGRPLTAKRWRGYCLFLLTPLREGRPAPGTSAAETISISTHAPAGGATASLRTDSTSCLFLLTPLREGRRAEAEKIIRKYFDFYSRPCGRGDAGAHAGQHHRPDFYSRPCGRGDQS